MILGVGVDAIEVERVRAALRRTPSLLGRLFTVGEQAACVTRCGDLRYGGLAARFAAKEAVAKALGTGVRGFRWLDVEVESDEFGKPSVRLHGAAAERAADLGVAAVHLSLSHSPTLAVANAVLESDSGPVTPRR